MTTHTDHNVLLPNLSEIPFGRDHADQLTALLGFDVRKLAPSERGQYRRIGGDPTDYHFLPDGRVALVRDRLFRGLSQVVVFSSQAAWSAWRSADGHEETYWGIQDPSFSHSAE